MTKKATLSAVMLFAALSLTASRGEAYTIECPGEVPDTSTPFAMCEGRPLLYQHQAPATIGGWNFDFKAMLTTGIGDTRPFPDMPKRAYIDFGSLRPRLMKTAKTSTGGSICDAGYCPAAGAADLTCTGSYVDNARWSYVHDAQDYATQIEPGACTCGSCATHGEAEGPSIGALSHLAVRRIHRPYFSFLPQSSFGAGAFSEYDKQLLFGTNGTNFTDVGFYDPRNDSDFIWFYDTTSNPADVAGDGVYNDRTTSTYKSIETFNASGARDPGFGTATKAVVTAHDGTKYVFEIIYTGAFITKYGRLTRVEDRNGNATVISYVFPQNATDTQLGGDSTQLWKMSKVTDMYGVAATITYNPSQIASRWTIKSIALPNSTTLQYGYAGPNPADQLAGTLTDVTYPNGSKTSIFVGFDTSIQEVLIAYTDFGGGVGGTVKTAYVTQQYILDDADQLVFQTPNLVRRVVRGNGLPAYRNWEKSDDPNTTYVYEGAGTLKRVIKDAVGNPQEVDVSTSPFDAMNGNPVNQPFVLDRLFTYNTASMMTRFTDGNGKATQLTRDANTRAVTKVVDASTNTTNVTYTTFRRPLKLTTAAGRTEDYTYDSKGNTLTIKQAGGDAALAGTWTYTYNSRGQPLTAKDANGNTTSFSYDAKGFLTQITQPPDVAGGTQPLTKFTYDTAGRLATTTDPDGRVITLNYDNMGRKSKLLFTDNTNITYTYGGDPSHPNLLSKVTDRNGNETTYQYDILDRPMTVTKAANRPEAAATITTYLDNTLLPTSQVINGERTTFTYDSRKRLVSKFSPNGNIGTVTYTYDGAGALKSEKDDHGRTTYHVYDSSGRRTRTARDLTSGAILAATPSLNIAGLARQTGTNPGYGIEDYAYDSDGNVTSKTDALGFVNTIHFDSRGRKDVETLASGTTVQSKTTFAYDLAGNLKREVRPRTFTSEGNSMDTFRTEYTYTLRHLRASTIVAAGRPDTGPEKATTSTTYTLAGLKFKETNELGGVTEYTYDTCCGRVISSKDPEGNITTFTYDGNGNKLTQKDALLHSTTYTFDGLNRVKTKKNGANETETYTYDDNMTDGLGIDATSSVTLNLTLGGGYDGSAKKTTKATGDTIIEVADTIGRPIRRIDELGNKTDTLYLDNEGPSLNLTMVETFDSLGRVTKVMTDGNGVTRLEVDALSKTTVHSPDARGNEVSVRDPLGAGRDCIFDALGRETSCTDTKGDKVQKTWDVESNLTSSTDPNGIASTFTYDFRNRRITIRDRLGNTSTTGYDKASNVVSRTDQEGRTTSYTFDNGGLKQTDKFPDNKLVTFTYDAARRVATIKDQNNNVITNGYDAANRLTSRAYPDGLNDGFTYDAASRITSATAARYGNTVSRTYDKVGRILQESTKACSTCTTYIVKKTYDAVGNPVTITYPDNRVATQTFDMRNDMTKTVFASKTINLAYDDARRPLTRTFPNGLKETDSYRVDGLLSGINLVKTSTSAVVFNDALTYDVNKRKTADNVNFASENQTLLYDADDRLTIWSRGTTAQTQSWTLTPVGDWSSTLINGTSQSRTHGSVHEVTAVAGAVLTYDGRGQLTTDDKGRTYAWDFNGQLKSTTASSTTTSFTYDAFGRRLTKVAGGVTTTFIVDGGMSDARVLAEYTNGTLARSFVFAKATDEPLMMVVGTSNYFFTFDNVRNVRVVTNDAGAIAERYRYDAYGTRTILNGSGTVILTSAIGNQTGYTGRYHDEDVGLVYFRFRYHSPRLGRFISRDSTYNDGPSLYRAYFAPNSVDPSGHGIEIGIVGSGYAQMDFCLNELTVNADLKLVAGVRGCIKYLGCAFVGVERSITKGSHTFGVALSPNGCGGGCSENCCNPALPKDLTVYAGIDLPKVAGLDCDFSVEKTACTESAVGRCSLDLVPWIPAIGVALSEIQDRTGISVLKIEAFGALSLTKGYRRDGSNGFCQGAVKMGIDVKVGLFT